MRHPRRLARPRSVEEVVQLLDRYGDDAKVVAGGTALSIALRAGLIDPPVVVALLDVPGLADYRISDGQLEIGAMATHRSVERSDLVQATIPVLARTFGTVATVRLRNAATVGGVVADAAVASDPPAVLRGLDATIVLAGPVGARSVPAAEFFVGVHATACGPSEIVTAVRIPISAAGSFAVYERFATRSAEDRPCIGVFASCRRSADGSFGDVRISVGATAARPERFPDAEAAAADTDLGADVIADLADRYAERIETIDDVRGAASYRTAMIRVLVRRVLERARVGALAA